MRTASELLGALGAGALTVVIARQMGASFPRAFGAVAVVPVLVATLIALPRLYDGAKSLNDQRHLNAALAPAEAQLKAGVDLGMNTGFLEWVKQHLSEDDTIHLEVGVIPNETYLNGAGVRQSAILQWSLFQLAPNLAYEQSPKARDVKPGEGRGADWIVFYEVSPSEYPVPLTDVETYTPKFAIGRPDAG